MSTVFPGNEALLRSRVLSGLRDSGRKGLAPEEIKETAGEGAALSEVRDTLDALEAAGEAFEIEGLWYSEEFGPWLVGVVEVLEEGDGLVRRPDARGQREQPEAYVRRRNLKGAMSGDTVLVRRMGHRAKEGDWRVTEGSVQKILNER
ncbi:MAG: hypothetical protein ACJ759_09860, partial [Thermoanaerobaculia bacterium]